MSPLMVHNPERHESVALCWTVHCGSRTDLTYRFNAPSLCAQLQHPSWHSPPWLSLPLSCLNYSDCHIPDMDQCSVPLRNLRPGEGRGLDPSPTQARGRGRMRGVPNQSSVVAGGLVPVNGPARAPGQRPATTDWWAVAVSCV